MTLNEAWIPPSTKQSDAGWKSEKKSCCCGKKTRLDPVGALTRCTLGGIQYGLQLSSQVSQQMKDWLELDTKLSDGHHVRFSDFCLPKGNGLRITGMVDDSVSLVIVSNQWFSHDSGKKWYHRWNIISLKFDIVRQYILAKKEKR